MLIQFDCKMTSGEGGAQVLIAMTSMSKFSCVFHAKDLVDTQRGPRGWGVKIPSCIKCEVCRMITIVFFFLFFSCFFLHF